MVMTVPGIDDPDGQKTNLAVQQLAAGRSNAIGTITLAVGAASTVVTPTQSGVIAPSSNIGFMPTTAAAAAELASGNFYVSSVGKDTFTITHTSSATTGRTFGWFVVG